MKYVTPILPKKASGTLKETYDDIEKHFPGPLPEPYMVYAHAPDFLASFWAGSKAAFFTDHAFNREYKDIIATGVSIANQCPFCVEAHSGLVEFTSPNVSKALQKNDLASIEDERLKALAQWATSSLKPESALIQNPPFAPAEKAEIVGTAVIFHSTNRFINIFFEDSPLAALPDISWLRKLMMFLFRPLAKKIAHLQIQRSDHGVSDDLALPEDMSWAETDHLIAKIFVDMAKISDEIGSQVLPEEVRSLLETKLLSWIGEPMPIGDSWLEEATSSLDEKHKPLGRLVLLAAFASHRVEEQDILRFREILPDDASLVKSVIWATFQIARRIGSWL